MGGRYAAKRFDEAVSFVTLIHTFYKLLHCGGLSTLLDNHITLQYNSMIMRLFVITHEMLKNQAIAHCKNNAFIISLFHNLFGNSYNL